MCIVVLVWRHAQNGTVEISAIGNRADFKEAFKMAFLKCRQVWIDFTAIYTYLF